MRQPLSTALLSLLALALLSLLQAGCLTTVEDACEAAAETHCANCFTCADEVDNGVDGRELCGIPEDEGDSLDDCEDFLISRCEVEAFTREDPYEALDRCERAVDEETCTDLVERESQGRPAAPDECRRYL